MPLDDWSAYALAGNLFNIWKSAMAAFAGTPMRSQP